nr:IQ domain-containing protein K [Meriones unguiculatus]
MGFIRKRQESLSLAEKASQEENQIYCLRFLDRVAVQNPKRAGEPFTKFFSIPFVEEWLKAHPRPPIPLSLLLTEEAAAVSIQAFWRAYLVRCDPEIQELRQWQKKLREDKHIRQRVKIFWAKQEQKIRDSKSKL